MLNSEKRQQEIQKLRQQLKAAEAEQRAAEEAEQKAIAAAQRHAGGNHTRAVLYLYELLGIEPEHERTRTVKGELRAVATDRDETHRTRRMIEMIEALTERADRVLIEEVQDRDREDRDSRKPKPKERVNTEPEIAATETDIGTHHYEQPSYDTMPVFGSVPQYGSSR